MDEATSALDYETERKVCDNLLSNLNDCTVFFITHRLSTIRKADMIVMLHEGAVVEVGTHDELMTQRGRYYALFTASRKVLDEDESSNVEGSRQEGLQPVRCHITLCAAPYRSHCITGHKRISAQ